MKSNFKLFHKDDGIACIYSCFNYYVYFYNTILCIWGIEREMINTILKILFGFCVVGLVASMAMLIIKITVSCIIDPVYFALGILLGVFWFLIEEACLGD